MRLDRYSRARDFLAAAGGFLVAREAEHNLMLGIAGNLPDEDHAADERPYFAVVRRAGDPVAAAMRTPPWNLLLSEIDDPAALEVLADDLQPSPLPGVTGPPDAVARFVERWTARHDVRSEVLMQERIYRLSRVIPPRQASGDAVRASADDRELLLLWVVAFHEEALPAEGFERARRMIEEWDPETGREFWLWYDDEGCPVSLVGAGTPTPHGIRIGPVYTPPRLRGRGYASALTAHVSQRALDSGRRFCFLYTDLANPTANRIYQAIGYEPVTDALMVRFVEA